MPRLSLFCLSAICIAFPAVAFAQQAPATTPPPYRIAGIGNSHLRITTANPEAQIWFDQGLTLLHDFWDYESVRAFQQSIRLDPKCAMCYWGLYEAERFREYGSPTPAVKADLQEAAKLAKHASPAEKLYIKAAQQGEKSDDKNDKPGRPANAKEIKTLRKLVALQPDDIEAKLALESALQDGFDDNSKPKPGMVEAQSILQAVLAQHPDDSAANHLWIHAQEPGLHPELALESARRLGALAPGSGHMVHMPGHIFYRVGDYEDARESFAASMRVDEDYMREHNVNVDDDWNYVHNLMYYIADLLEEGRIHDATQVSAKLVAARGSSRATLYPFNARDGIARIDPELPVLMRAGDWQSATQKLQASKLAAGLDNLANLRECLLDYTQGMEALQAGDTTTAAKLSADLDAWMQAHPEKPAMHQMPGMKMPSAASSKDADAKPVHSYLNVASQELRGAVLMAQGKTKESDDAFTKAAKAEVNLGYHEPPFYIRPVNESRGDALMRAKQYKQAVVAYQAALAERPNSGYPQYGIAQAESAAGNVPAARTAYAAFLKDWAHADSDLPQLKVAQEQLAKLQLAALETDSRNSVRNMGAADFSPVK